MDMSDPFTDGIPCLWMRGGTSKGAYFLAQDLPSDPVARDRLLLRIMGSPDPRQIDGIGGGTSLCSKVAILSPSTRADADVDYLFLQVYVDQALVSDAQNCGNILAGVGPAALERGLIDVAGHTTRIRIHMLNAGEVAIAEVQTAGGRVQYAGQTSIDGVPGRHAPVTLLFDTLAGSACGALLPTGALRDTFDGVEVSCIDNGMPVVLLRASDVGLTGLESVAELDANPPLKAQLERMRLALGQKMGLGDVTQKSVPKMTLVSAPSQGGVINTRSFIPHQCHSSIGVFAAVSVATACALPGSIADGVAQRPEDERYLIEHPTGAVEIRVETDAEGKLLRAGTQRTARKLFDGRVFPAPEAD